MFYLLIIFGSSLIILGLFNNNKDKNENLNIKSSNPTDFQELRKLEYRIENLENMMFYIEEKEEKEEEKPSDSLKTFEKICKYEKENYTLEEISQLLEMNKGEVLLLKNLYKNY